MVRCVFEVPPVSSLADKEYTAQRSGPTQFGGAPVQGTQMLKGLSRIHPRTLPAHKATTTLPITPVTYSHSVSPETTVDIQCKRPAKINEPVSNGGVLWHAEIATEISRSKE
jgi:hypothetical protein